MSNVNLNQIRKGRHHARHKLLQRLRQAGHRRREDLPRSNSRRNSIALAQQRAGDEISEAESQDGVSDLKALAKMEAIKQAGLAQAAIDQLHQRHRRHRDQSRSRRHVITLLLCSIVSILSLPLS